MNTGRINIAADIAGLNFTGQISRSATGGIVESLSGENPIGPAAPGTLSTRTNNTDGTLTMGNPLHGITTGAKIDLYWEGGRRYDVTVGTVSGTSVPISSGAGDNLPTQDTAITAKVQTVIDCDFLGDLLAMLVMNCTQRSRVGFYNGVTLLSGFDLAANEPFTWAKLSGTPNPLASGTVTQAKVSQSSTTAAANFALAVLYEAA